MTCRICLENEGYIISPCGCTGTCGAIHLKCLQQWIDISAATSCEICKVSYSHPLLTSNNQTSNNQTSNNQTIIIVLRIVTIVAAFFQGGTIVIDSEQKVILMFAAVFLFNISHCLLWILAYHESNVPEQISLIWICTVVLAVVGTSSLFAVPFNDHIMFGCLCNMITASVGLFLKFS